MVEAASLIIELKAAVELRLQSAGSLEKGGVLFAYMKAVEVVSKSLLSRCLPYDT